MAYSACSGAVSYELGSFEKRTFHPAICKIGVLSKDASANEQDKIWGFDYRLGLDVLLDIGLPDEALDKIFCKNAQKFYASL